MRTVLMRAGTAFVTLVLVSCIALPAQAGTIEVDEVQALEMLEQNVSMQSAHVLDDLVRLDVEPGIDGDISAEVPGVSTQIPASVDDPLVFASEETTGAPDVEIQLPFATTGSAATVHTEGVVSFDNENDSTTVVAAKVDGSVQVATVIESAEAPVSYSYNYEVDGGASLILEDDGRVHVIGPEGYAVAVIEPAWAFDAQGRTVPTHFEVSGTQVIQHVEHSTQYSYPIVADPKTLYYWWGQAIKFTKSETATIANSANDVQVVAIFCGLIASAPGAVVCGVVAFTYINAFAKTFQKAKSQGKCGQINMPYVGVIIGGPLTWSAHVVTC